MSAEYDAAMEICGKLEEIRSELDAIWARMPDRRERIATAVLQGLLADSLLKDTPSGFAKLAVEQADALIAVLDAKKPPINP